MSNDKITTNRVNNSIRNTIVGFICQIFFHIFNFLTRFLLIRYIGIEIVGLNSVFVNIISILSVVELGFSTAIIIDIYKPIVVNDKRKVAALLMFYKKVYSIIGIAILLIGLLLMPFLRFIVEVSSDVTVNIYISYLLVLINTVVGYYFTYKKTLFIASQQNFIVELNKAFFALVKNVLLVVVIIQTSNYYLYLIVQPIFLLLENLTISYLANKKYSDIISMKNETVTNEEKNKIYKDVKALMIHRICDAFVLSTDSIIISFFLGVLIVGYFSNYYIIISFAGVIAIVLGNQLSSSVGNLLSLDESETIIPIFEKIMFINFLLIGILSAGMVCLSSDFIKIWLGEEYMLSTLFVVLLIASFYVRYSRESIAIFKNTKGLFVKDKYFPIIKVFLNLSISIILIQFIGLNGVVIGTIVSILLTNVIVEPIVVYKHLFKSNVFTYFKKYIIYSIATIFVTFITYKLTSFIIVENYFLFILKGIAVGGAALLFYSILYCKSKNFHYFLNLFFTKLKIRKE